jgi:hypothetical protein
MTKPKKRPPDIASRPGCAFSTSSSTTDSGLSPVSLSGWANVLYICV